MTMMKRIILLIVVCLCCFSACSQKDLPIEYKLDSVSATSVEDFLAKFSDVEIQATKGNALLYAVSSLNLNVESYEIRILEYIRWQNDDREYWGSECIEVYWHPVDCSCPTDGGCNPICLTLNYDPAGIDMVAEKKGYDQIENSDFYVKEVSFGRTAYVYVVNGQYWCRFSLETENPDHDAIVGQLHLFCETFQASLKNDNAA